LETEHERKMIPKPVVWSGVANRRVRAVAAAALTCFATVLTVSVPFGVVTSAQNPPESRSTPTGVDLAAGERAFAARCASCHGQKGEGAVGPALAVPALRRAQDEDALMQVIRDGIPGTGMPPSTTDSAETREIAAYVWTIGGHTNRLEPAGDVRAGEAIFRGKGGCDRCHTVAGRGGAIGPDLADVGGRRERESLRTSILDPEASVVSGFSLVRVTTKDGRGVTGIRLNEDTFSIHLRDLSNNFHSFWKSELAEVVNDPRRSPMPSYRDTLSMSELEALLSYLMSLGSHR